MGSKSIREKIAGAKDRKVETVHVPEWGVTVGVRVWSGKERDQWEQDLVSRHNPTKSEVEKHKDATVLKHKLLSLTLVDADSGEALFENETDAATVLGEKNSVVVDSLFDKAMSINKLKEEDKKVAGKN